MGGIGAELSYLPEGVIQPDEHGVEGSCQPVQFIPGAGSGSRS